MSSRSRSISTLPYIPFDRSNSIYDVERGGVHPDPWHLSWAPISVPALGALTSEVLREAIESAEIEGKPAVLEALDRIHAVQVCRVGEPERCLIAGLLGRTIRK